MTIWDLRRRASIAYLALAGIGLLGLAVGVLVFGLAENRKLALVLALIPLGIIGGLILSLFGGPLIFSHGGFGGFSSGGGFGGFSGGGGGFGGGGASGGW